MRAALSRKRISFPAGLLAIEQGKKTGQELDKGIELAILVPDGILLLAR
jgi:hypothetical protein